MSHCNLRIEQSVAYFEWRDALTDIPGVGNPMAGMTEATSTPSPRGEGWRLTGDGVSSAGSLPGLLDVSVVRAELARLRAPRPATELYTARAPRSTISGGR